MKTKFLVSKTLLLGVIACLFSYGIAKAGNPKVSFKLGKGMTIIDGDSMVSLNISFFMQDRLDVLKVFDKSIKPMVTPQVKRLRLSFKGFAFTPKLEYTIQLGFSPSDIKSGIVEDGFIKYSPVNQFAIQFGQGKLPGEREEMTSDNNLQFVDRSTTAGFFKLDRDFGLQFQSKFGKKVIFKPTAAISIGEGRNFITSSWQHFDYTFRAELQPMGEFTNKGDYSYGDLAREEKPKLAIAVAYDFNNKAGFTKGQLVGDAVADSVRRDIQTIFADMNFKYKGMSLSGEYADRFVTDNTTYVTGQSFWVAAGYNCKKNYEAAFRFTRSFPGKKGNINEMNEYTIGFSKYVYGQAVKIQTDYTLIDNKTTGKLSGLWRVQFQIVI